MVFDFFIIDKLIFKTAHIGNPKSEDADHQIDGIAGATLTARGVEKLVEFWLGKDGYGPYLMKLRDGEKRE